MMAAFIDWAPVRAARIFLGHIALAFVCMVGIWALEHASIWLFQGQEPNFFGGIPGIGGIPLKWFFDAGEATMLAIFTVSGIYEAYVS